MKLRRLRNLHRIVFFLILFLIVVPMGKFSASAAGGELVGSGTENDPYLISSVEDLNSVRNDLDAHYKLVCDIVFTDADFHQGTWSPIGSNNAPFSGTFDGNGFQIEGLRIERELTFDDSVGLFGFVTGTVKNVGLKGATINVSSVSPTAQVYVGSVVGFGYSATVSNCYCDGRITVSSYGNLSAGGIVGRILGTNSVVENCYFAGRLATVVFENAQVGGIVGSVSGTLSEVSDCFNMGFVSSKNSDVAYVGGIIGRSFSGSIKNVYNVGNVIGPHTGGILGCFENTSVENAYFLDECVSFVDSTDFVGRSCTWDEMKQKESYAGFDFDMIWSYDDSADFPCPILKGLGEPIWDFEENTDDFFGGTGVPWDPYLIQTKEHLNNVRNYLDSHFKLLNDIAFSSEDFSENGWNPIGESVENDFCGYFDGNGFTVENLKVDLSESDQISGGLFGYHTGVIQNLGVANATITASLNAETFAGGIVGWSCGEIRNCYFSGEVIGASCGGMVGVLHSGTVVQCYNIGKIYGEREAGGIAGRMDDGTIQRCYNAGRISSLHGTVGGIVGTCFGELDACYYLEKSARGVGAGAEQAVKCSYADMTKQTVFSGFDFETVWTMEGDFEYYYPELQAVSMKFECNVEAIEISELPSKLTYVEGDSLDCDGMVVIYRYNNGETKIVENYNIVGYSDTIGTQTITVEKDGLTASFPVTVLKKSVTSIQVTTLPKKTVYVEKESFESNGMVVTAYYNNNTSAEIFDYEIDGYSSSVGTKIITVSYREAKTSFTVTVEERMLTSISVTQLPKKLIYLEGDSFKKSGMVVRAYYNNNTSKEITDYEIEGYTSAAGDKTITVVYNGKSDSFTVTVKEKSLQSIKVTKKPTRSTYVEGESFDPSGMIVKAYYDNDTSEEISNYVVDGYEPTVGTKTLTVTYKEVFATFTVSVVEKSLTSIGVTTLPRKAVYLEGDEFDGAGMEVVAYYDNGTSCVITDYTVRGFTSNPGKKEITVSYQRKTARFYVTVKEKTLTSIVLTKLPNKLTYTAGDPFKKDGMVVTAHYDNNTVAVVKDYAINGFSSQVGKRRITVTYGGKSTEFFVTVNPKIPSVITSPTYTVNDDCIGKIAIRTPVSTLLSKLNEGVFCAVYRGETPIASDGFVGTGMTVKITDKDKVKASRTVIVTGDINGDGDVTVTDLLSVKSHLLNKSKLKTVYGVAADTNGDGEISITDFLQIKAKILRRSEIIPRDSMLLF